MLPGIQLLGILFALVMVYFTFLYYKRGSYGTRAFVFWMVLWGGFLFLASFPRLVYGFMDVLAIERTADFFVIIALLIFSVIIFNLYVRQKQFEEKLEKVVRKVAFDRAYREKQKEKRKE